MAAVYVSVAFTAMGQTIRPVENWDLANAHSRTQAVKRLRDKSETSRDAAWKQAKAEGWSPKGRFNGRDFELQAIFQNRIYMFATDNLNAGISSAANLVRNTAPYNLNGTGVTVGVWDAGDVLATHVELTGRITLKDPTTAASHSTHVAGTIAATGVAGAAIGMAPGARIDSYEWNNDVSEMASLGMTIAGEVGKIQLSNHSYGYVAGWETGSWSGTSGPHWFGQWGDRECEYFGQYDFHAHDLDTVCHNCPYYLPFIAAANNRNNAAPAAGTNFYYFTTTWRSKAYVAATDPYSDGWNAGGYDTLPMISVAKNAMIVGAVNDAVSGGARSLANATMASFSGWGPTDDGRVKPDIVGNGVNVYSCDSAGTSSYATMSGTSMATPSACGSAALLIDEYSRLFSSQAMLASTLKGLIIHTADDLGLAGPDYQFGWGLMNTKAAADLLVRHHAYPAVGCLTESFLAAGSLIRTNAIKWDGANSMRVTLCWTDPAGAAQTTLNSTSHNLVNDLDLRMIGPLGEVYYPYVLTPTNPAAVAGTGDNNLDNVEQVYLATPGNSGIYYVTVKIDGAMTGTTQHYSLAVSGTVEPTVSLVVTGTPYNVSAASPGYGAHVYMWGSGVTAGVAGSYVYSNVSNSLTWVCTGWVGTGSVPVGGSGTNTGAFIMRTNSIVNWQWVVTDLALSNQTINISTNYQVRDTITAGDGFVVTPQGGVTLKAGKSIRLSPGFTADTGSFMRAVTGE